MEPEQPSIRLDQFLKLMGLVRSGGEAKFLVQDSQVMVNGKVDTRRSHKLHNGDRVSFNGVERVVDLTR